MSTQRLDWLCDMSIDSVDQHVVGSVDAPLDHVCDMIINAFWRITLNVIIYVLISMFDLARPMELYDD